MILGPDPDVHNAHVQEWGRTYDQTNEWEQRAAVEKHDSGGGTKRLVNQRVLQAPQIEGETVLLVAAQIDREYPVKATGWFGNQASEFCPGQ